MKKLIALLLVLVLLLSASLADEEPVDYFDLDAPASERYDLSGMSYEELVAMKDQINLAMWNSQEWQEVIVPNGTWKIGEDIPAGHWTITSRIDCFNTIIYSNEMDDNGYDLDWVLAKKAIYETICGPEHWMYNGSQNRSISIDCKEGFWIQISGGPVQFTPYQGKPSFGFK